ncbi:isoamyl alcohol oxidase/dehydrogenase [Colletotrichum tofieldiae]|uniref:Isoamyl alcohol oxidase/dehydrogenase n=1 Tax=Colletotrichum tofieldiae TaxID=708197 RepID=A0A166PAW2_9PEZI|nr:isoamyl alcohol oxidase/dehydrogenase [Colletotrichum tofieldiae]GKT82223.1 isoamyl alcohol oxidase/dehydrogenase [Colletotrichum tofieldiae]
MKFALSTLLALQAVVGSTLSATLPSKKPAIVPSKTILRPIQRRQDSVPAVPLGPAKFTPKTNVTLSYEGHNATNALVRAMMKRPAILLENIETIADVQCSDTGVLVKFGVTEDYHTCLSAWPSKDFIIVTNQDNGCASEYERGIYVVQGYTFDNATLTLTASATRAEIRDQMNDAVIDFQHTGTATTKRDLSGTISADLSGSTLIATDPLTIVANEARLESTVSLAGHVHYDFWKFKVNEFYIDLDYASALNLNISAAVNAEYSTDLYNYNPLSVSVSAFSIPGIIDVGPMVDFGLGIEFAASGTVKASVDVVTTISDANVHLDFLDASKTSTTGWKPQTNVTTDIDAQVELQLNPFADLTVALGVKLFNGLLDMSAGVEAKPTVVNAFAVDVDFTYNSASGVVFTKPTGDQCINGAWFASTFHFAVEAFVTQFYTKSLYEVDVPIYQSQCWNFVH